MEKWKKNLLAHYVNNFIGSRQLTTGKINNFVDWYSDEGQNLFFKFEWITSKEKEYFCDFRDIYQKRKSKCLQRINDFRQKMQAYALKHSLILNNSLNLKIDQICRLLQLSTEEKKILLALVVFKTQKEFKAFNYSVEDGSEDIFDVLHYYLGISDDKLAKLTREESNLYKLGLITQDCDDLKISNMTLKLINNKIRSVEDIKSYLVGKKLSSNLNWQDFAYIEEKDYCAKLIKKALTTGTKGVNILLYGAHGTGKTEFSKILMQQIKAELYGLGENIDGENRRKQLNLASKLLEKERNTCLLIDEADDFLESSNFCDYDNRRFNNKLYVNRMLENNRNPTIWIVNDIEELDKAFLRRFTFAINFSKPSLKTRTQMWQKALKQNNLSNDEKIAKEFALQYSLSPSFITTAVKSAKLIKGGLNEVKQSLNALEKAYCNGRSHLQILKKETDFNADLLNTDTNLKKLAEQICGLPQHNFSLCLYGASGTGKSAYVEYLSDKIGMPYIKKRCSDLLSMWVGETERNIARAFEEGKENQAVLVFDEADSFLQDRNKASRSWEVSQVNEMLTQMETYPYPFVCTTNLMNSLDKASLRRFTFKVEYKYMTKEQSRLAFKHFFGIENVDLSHLNSLTPGDFVVVKQKAQILGVMNDCSELVEMLELEQKNKAPVSHHIGFI